MGDLHDIQWPVCPGNLSLGEREVHVWAASLNPPEELAFEYEATLSDDERARAARFLFERDRRRFRAGRGTLRTILSEYLGENPAKIELVYSERGKPYIAGLDPEDRIQFNLAHSDDLAVYAVSRIPAIGIDLEKLRHIKDAAGIAERFFSKRETRVLNSLPPRQRERGFFNLWTRKEAWLKATGEGIGEFLSQVEVSVKPGEPARVLSIFNNVDEAEHWSLRELVPAKGYLGALAVPAREFEMKCWAWEPRYAPHLAISTPRFASSSFLQ